MLTRDVPIPLKLRTRRESAPMFEVSVCPIRGKRWEIRSEITVGRQSNGYIDRAGAFVRECWIRMCQMKAEVDRSNTALTAEHRNRV